MKINLVLLCALLFISTAFVWSRTANNKEVKRRIKRLDPASATILIGFMISGATLAHQGVQGLMAPTFNVAVGFDIENFSRWAMRLPKVYIEAGYVNKPPRPIFPMRREGMAAHKAAHTATGSLASVSWLIGKERLIIMWSVPYSHDWSNNWLAIGMKSNHTREDTKTMLKDEKQWFKKMAYYYGSQTLIYVNDKIVVMGQMGTSHRPVVRVQIYARKWDDLPKQARDQIKKEQYRVI